MDHIRSISNLNSAAGNRSPSRGYLPASDYPVGSNLGSGSPSRHRSNRRSSIHPLVPRALCLATTLGALALPILTLPAHAVESNTGSTDSISLSIEMQCSFMTKGAASVADGSYRATGANGTDATFADGNNTRTFNIACNQISGYTVRGYTTDLVKEGGSDTMAFVDYASYDSTKSGTPGVGIWSAELVDADAGATFGTQATPNILKHTTEASNVNGDEFSVNYMAYIGRTTPSGTYTGEAVYQLAMNPLVTDYDWSVTYSSGTAGTNATGMPSDQSGENVDLGDTVPVTLGATPTWQYHTFAGWKDQNDGIHAAGSTIEVSETSNIWTMTAQWDEVAVDYSVAFNANLPSGVASLTSGSIPSTLSDTVNMSTAQSKTFSLTSTSEPAIDGYTFLGWSESSSATSASYTKDGRNGTATSITLQSATPSTTLYAIWKKNQVTFQAFTSTDCNAITTGSTINVQDDRDGKIYLVSKLADNHCWMVQNLALAPGTTITSTDSDVSSNYTIPENTEFNAVSGQSNTSDAYYEKESAILPAGDSGYIAATRNGYNASGSADNSKNTGAYYSYHTAVAGTNKGSSNQSKYAPASICPKGWRLPTRGEQSSLLSAYSSNRSSFAPVWGSALVGYYSGGSLNSSGSDSYWWSGTRYSYYVDAYYLYMNASSVGTNSSYRYSGYSVRCIFGSR